MIDDMYLGLPFQRNGRGSPGYDCWGLVKRFLVEQFEIADLPEYLGVTSVHLEIKAAKNNGTWTETMERRRGVLVVMSTPVGRGRSAELHVGVMTDRRNVLHIDMHMPSMCQPLDSPFIAPRVESFWLHRDLVTS